MTEPKRYDRPPLLAYVVGALVIAGLVGWYVLTQVRVCATHCNGECATTCEPSILDNSLNR